MLLLVVEAVLVLSCGKSFSSTTEHDSMTREHMTKQSEDLENHSNSGSRQLPLGTTAGAATGGGGGGSAVSCKKP